MSSSDLRFLSRLGYLDRLQKQYEENRLRAPLDAVEDANCLQLDHIVRSAFRAEQLLRESLVPFQPLDDKHIEHREEPVKPRDGQTRPPARRPSECRPRTRAW